MLKSIKNKVDSPFTKFHNSATDRQTDTRLTTIINGPIEVDRDG